MFAQVYQGRKDSHLLKMRKERTCLRYSDSHYRRNYRRSWDVPKMKLPPLFGKAVNIIIFLCKPLVTSLPAPQRIWQLPQYDLC